MKRSAAGGVDCPYAGLQPYDRQLEAYFFGRKLDALTIVDSLLARPLSVLYGASGVGKSSVLNVGLPKALKELGAREKPAVFRRWFPADSAMRWLRQQSQTRARRKLLVLDQFEEVFLYGGVDPFVRALAEMLKDQDGDLHVLIALRDDALHRLDALRVELPELLDETRELRHLDEAAVHEAIERPIEVYNERERAGLSPVRLGAGFADGVIRELRQKQRGVAGVFDSSAGRIELPFLQLTLTAVWEAEGGREAKALETSTLEDRLGGVDGIAATHVETSLGVLTRSDRNIASKIVHYLVTPSGGKIAFSIADLAYYTGAPRERIRELLKRLSQDARLLRGVGQDRPDDPYSARFELFHDVLADPALAWQARYRVDGPFASLVELFSGKEYELRGSGQIFGRLSVYADHIPGEPLSDPIVSRCHIVILANNEILDLRSRNGTTVNASPLVFGEPGEVKGGDLIVLGGKAAFRYLRADDADKKPELAGERHWGALVDGPARRVRYLEGRELYLGFGADGAVKAVRTKSAAFGRLRYSPGQSPVFEALTDEPITHAVWAREFQSTYYSLHAGDAGMLGDQMTGIFSVGDRPFQIVLSPRAAMEAKSELH